MSQNDLVLSNSGITLVVVVSLDVVVICFLKGGYSIIIVLVLITAERTTMDAFGLSDDGIDADVGDAPAALQRQFSQALAVFGDDDDHLVIDVTPIGAQSLQMRQPGEKMDETFRRNAFAQIQAKRTK